MTGITVNGRERSLSTTPVHESALDFLRGLGLTGAKEGCAEGECGACSVMVVRLGVDGASQWTAINACLVPALALDGQEVVTAEGLGTPDDLHPVQREMAERGGSQCGYCTPGFVCSMAAEYYRTDRESGEPSLEHGPNGFDLHALSGNLCRCTGYRETVRRPDELIRALRIPLPLAEVTAFHKIAKRRFDDISSVAVGFAIDVADGLVKTARIGLGGVAATPIRALATEAALEGQPWTESTVRAAAAVLRTEGTPMDDHRASAAYRSAMLGNALLRLWAETGAGAPSSTTGGGVPA